MENWKKSIIQGAICIGLLCVIWGGYYVFTHYGTDRILEVKSDDFSWVYQVDSVEIEGKDFVLQGFAFELDKNVEKGAYEIVLEDIESGERYFPRMEYIERKDVNEYFLCEYDYLQSGFEATIKAKKLSLEEKNYEILLRVKGDRQAYQTGTYITEGKLCYAEPSEFIPLDVEGTDLEEIVECGVLRVYQPDYGIYVYQYKEELYWIADEHYDFYENGKYVECQIDTTQVGRLPEERLMNQWYWDNIGFVFLSNELVEYDFGKYRVAKKKIPVEYSIVKIWTGNHVNGWIWRQDFRPYYQFEK